MVGSAMIAMIAMIKICRVVVRVVLSAALLWSLQSTTAAESIDWQRDAQSVTIDHAESLRRWRALFTVAGRQPTRDVAYLLRRQPSRAIELLGYRLLYRGDPWLRRGQKISPERWALHDKQVKKAILRALRYRAGDSSALVSCYQQFLRLETDERIASAAIMHLIQLDEQAARKVLYRLVVPELAADAAWPGANLPAMRRKMTRIALDYWGADATELRHAWSFALLEGHGEERLAAVMQIPHGVAPELRGRALQRYLDEWQRGQLDEAGRMGLVRLLFGIRPGEEIEPVLRQSLVSLVLRESQDIAGVAAEAVQKIGQPLTTTQVQQLVQQVQACTDLGLRHALMRLLVWADPVRARQVSGPRSPWTRIANHRQTIAELH